MRSPAPRCCRPGATTPRSRWLSTPTPTPSSRLRSGRLSRRCTRSRSSTGPWCRSSTAMAPIAPRARTAASSTACASSRHPMAGRRPMESVGTRPAYGVAIFLRVSLPRPRPRLCSGVPLPTTSMPQSPLDSVGASSIRRSRSMSAMRGAAMAGRRTTSTGQRPTRAIATRAVLARPSRASGTRTLARSLPCSGSATPWRRPTELAPATASRRSGAELYLGS
mmetsp:Transcript_97424/g.313907  ORF Transcript_97424/g.313907 Transcript_97424/m.313907 type:complete len:222 (-) Transcript_97424:1806-2471(-)